MLRMPRSCDTPTVRRGLAAVVVITLLAGAARADDTPPSATPDITTPWIDLHPSAVLTNVADDQPADHRVVAGVGMGALYATLCTFSFYAWYAQHKPLAQYKFGGDGWLGYRTYAGGADKFGHAWSTMALARLGTEILSAGGYDRNTSILVGTALSELYFIGVEVSDGFYFEFSFSDATGDTVGMLLALALMYSPRLDEMFDFRVQYLPSPEYRYDLTTPGAPGRLNIDDDYNGQTYLLAYHLGSIHALRDMKYGTLARFVDITAGFDTRGYKPTPVTGDLPAMDHHQNLFIGVSLNAQGLFDWLLEGRHHEGLRKVSHGVFEVFNIPKTSAAVLEYTRTPTELPTTME